MPDHFHVFISHNSRDKPAVIKLAKRLKAQGLKVWLDVWELRPGQPWQEALEHIIETTQTAAVLVGADGFGPWQSREMRGCLSEFAEHGKAVIPVLLPTCPTEVPELPFFLKQLTWVDLRDGKEEEGFYRLIWGITGKKPPELDEDSLIVPATQTSSRHLPIGTLRGRFGNEEIVVAEPRDERLRPIYDFVRLVRRRLVLRELEDQFILNCRTDPALAEIAASQIDEWIKNIENPPVGVHEGQWAYKIKQLSRLASVARMELA